MASLTVENGTQIPVIGSILESLEKSNVKVEYQCRAGFCGQCKMKLKRGSVVYTTQPLGFFKEDEVLICCSTPLGDVEIETL